MPSSGESLYNHGYAERLREGLGGRVELDADLPEGASVTVLVLEGDGPFEADPATEKVLLETIAECDRNETTPMPPRVSTATSNLSPACSANTLKSAGTPPTPSLLRSVTV